ncbi:MAG: hypothetical protein KDA89_06740, partial [Planctomycetaceae bacterium]|nr:hypothetical protein [Planctomycetaceae bacterium]
MKRTLFFILVVVLTAGVLSACNIPVFRYALERWKTDDCEIIVFHESPLTTEDAAFVDELRQGCRPGVVSADSDVAGPDAAVANVAVVNSPGSRANAVVRLLNVNDAEAIEDSVAHLLSELRQSDGFQLPYVAVRQTVAGRSVNSWHGPLDECRTVGILSSPLRDRLRDRLLSGDAVIWLVLRSRDAKRSQDVIDHLGEQLQQLSNNVPLPDGIGLPGSELFSDLPLLMKFTVTELHADDDDEQFLVSMLKGFDAAAFDAGEPLVVPVFGRGRALEVIPASRLNDPLVKDLTLFLCGACSCQVKERNPGFDLLMNASWDADLFGDGPSPEPGHEEGLGLQRAGSAVEGAANDGAANDGAANDGAANDGGSPAGD